MILFLIIIHLVIAGAIAKKSSLMADEDSIFEEHPGHIFMGLVWPVTLPIWLGVYFVEKKFNKNNER